MQQIKLSTFKRSGLAILLALFGGLFYTSAPVLAGAPAQVQVGGVICQTGTMVNCNGAGWRYDKPSSTLILENYDGGQIHSVGGDLNIRLKGDNTITGGNVMATALLGTTGFAPGNGRVFIDAEAGGTLTLNKTNRVLDIILASDSVVISGGTIILKHQHAAGNCDNSTTAMIGSMHGKIVIDGDASLTAEGEGCYTGAGIPEQIFRAKTGIEFKTSGNVMGIMKAAPGVIDKSKMTVMGSIVTNLVNNLVFGGTGNYTFQAPQQVFSADGYGVIGAQLAGGQKIHTPAGAKFNAAGVLVDVGNNDIRATTNKLVISPAPVPVTYNLTINCGVGGSCVADHANPYNDSETATITLAPNVGKKVKTVIGATKVNDTTYTVLMNADKTVTVEFENIPLAAHTITVNKGVATPKSAIAGTVINLVANSAPSNQVFDKWTSVTPGVVFTDATKPNTSFTMLDQDVTISATYKPIAHNLIVNCGAGGVCNTNPGAGNYDHGTTIDLDVQANAGKVIDEFLVNGVVEPLYSHRGIDKVVFTFLLDQNINIKITFVTPKVLLATDKYSYNQADALELALKASDASLLNKKIEIYLESNPIKIGEVILTDLAWKKVKLNVPCAVAAGSHTVRAKIGAELLGSSPIEVKRNTKECLAKPEPTDMPGTPKTGVGANSTMLLIISTVVTALGGLGLTVILKRN